MLILMLFFSAFCYDLIEKFDDLSIQFMRAINRFDHGILGYLIGAGFDHDHLFAGRCHRQGEIRFFSLFTGRIVYQFAIDQTNLCGSRRPIKRNIRNTCCQGRAKHGKQFRGTVLIHIHHKVFKGHIIAVIFWEQRPHRAVDDTAGKDGIVRRFPLPSCKAAGNPSHRIHFFMKFYAKREEINSFPRFLRSSRCRQYNGIAITHKSCAVCLGSNSSNINGQCSPGKFHTESLIHTRSPFIDSCVCSELRNI